MLCNNEEMFYVVLKQYITKKYIRMLKSSKRNIWILHDCHRTNWWMNKAVDERQMYSLKCQGSTGMKNCAFTRQCYSFEHVYQPLKLQHTGIQHTAYRFSKIRHNYAPTQSANKFSFIFYYLVALKRGGSLE